MKKFLRRFDSWFWPVILGIDLLTLVLNIGRADYGQWFEFPLLGSVQMVALPVLLWLALFTSENLFLNQPHKESTYESR